MICIGNGTIDFYLMGFFVSIIYVIVMSIGLMMKSLDKQDELTGKKILYSFIIIGALSIIASFLSNPVC